MSAVSVPGIFKMIEISSLEIDEKVRSRVDYDPSHLKMIYKSYKRGKDSPPPVVIFYDGSRHILSDGFYRVYALQKNGVNVIEADIRDGNWKDAVSYSCTANNTKNFSNLAKRTNKCKAKAVINWLLYVDPERKVASNVLAELLGISAPTVTKIRHNFAETERRARAKQISSGKKGLVGSKKRRKRSLISNEIKVALGVLRREIELKRARQWNNCVKEEILENIKSLHDWVNESL